MSLQTIPKIPLSASLMSKPSFLSVKGFRPVRVLSQSPRSIVTLVSIDNLNSSEPEEFVLKTGNIGGPVEIEFRTLRDLGSHPHIVSLIDFGKLNESHFSILIEKVPGVPVIDLLTQNGRLSEKESVLILKQIAKAVEYIHGHRMIHRDIKPDNIMYDPTTGIAKLIDFEFCKKITEVKENQGTRLYSPPEIWSPKCRYGPWIDVWSFGVTIFVMVMGVFPYTAEEMESKPYGPLNADVLVPELKSEISSSCFDLLSQTLNVKYQLRPSMKQIQTHEWMGKSTSFISFIKNRVKRRTLKTLI